MIIADRYEIVGEEIRPLELQDQLQSLLAELDLCVKDQEAHICSLPMCPKEDVWERLGKLKATRLAVYRYLKHLKGEGPPLSPHEEEPIWQLLRSRQRTAEDRAASRPSPSAVVPKGVA